MTLCSARPISVLFVLICFFEGVAVDAVERFRHVRGVNSGRKLLGDSSLGEESIEEFETLSIILGILSLVCCVGCFGYYWYNKKEQYNSWINEDVPRYIVL